MRRAGVIKSTIKLLVKEAGLMIGDREAQEIVMGNIRTIRVAAISQNGGPLLRHHRHCHRRHHSLLRRINFGPNSIRINLLL